MRLLATCMTLFAGVWMTLSAKAQTNFSGTWKLKETEYVTGPHYSNAMAEQLKVTQKADSLILESGTSRSAIAFNGDPTISTSASTKRKSTRSLAWSADKKSLVMTTAISLPDNPNEVDLTRVDTWTMEKGTLTINRKSIETRSETWEAKGTYIKE